MTQDENNNLRADVSAYFQPTQPEQELPLPDAAPRATMTPAQIEVAFENYVGYIMSMPTNAWTTKDRQAVLVASGRALRTLGR